MGLAFGILGVLTFASMFGMGYCLSKKSQLNGSISELQRQLNDLKGTK